MGSGVFSTRTYLALEQGLYAVGLVPTAIMFEAVRNFPKVTIAQVHGYCLGGALALMNSHDLVIAAVDVQIGMPEILRGSFGQMATSTLFHSGLPMKKAALIQLLGRNISGVERY